MEPIKVVKSSIQATSDIYINGKDTKLQPQQFVFSPIIKESNFLNRKLITKILENKTFLVDELYKYIYTIYNKKWTNPSQKELDLQKWVKEFVSPGSFKNMTAKNKTTIIENNNPRKRLQSEMARIINAFLIELNKKSSSQPMGDTFLKEIIKNLNLGINEKRTNAETIKYFSDNFLFGGWRRNIPTLFGFLLVEKINGTNINSVQNSDEKNMLQNFDEFIGVGKVKDDSQAQSPETNYQESANAIGIYKMGETIYTDKLIPWVPRTKVYEIWITTTTLITLIVIFKYFRTDFK